MFPAFTRHNFYRLKSITCIPSSKVSLFAHLISYQIRCKCLISNQIRCKCLISNQIRCKCLISNQIRCKCLINPGYINFKSNSSWMSRNVYFCGILYFYIVFCLLLIISFKGCECYVIVIIPTIKHPMECTSTLCVPKMYLSNLINSEDFEVKFWSTKGCSIFTKSLRLTKYLCYLWS